MNKKRQYLKENLTGENIDLLFRFFTNFYYNNNGVGLTGSNEFDYNLGVVDFISLIKDMEENNINLKVVYNDDF